MTTKNFILIFTLLLLCQSSSFSHGVAIDNSGSNFRLNSSHVEVSVNNQISVVTSSQNFINNSSLSTRVKYAFPLPDGANPISLRWKVDGIWKEAEVSGDNQDPDLPSNGGSGGSGGGSGNGSNNLDDYLGDNPLYFDLADVIEPGQSIEFEMTYVELLSYSFGEVSFHYPNNYGLIQDEPIESSTFSFTLESERTIDDIELMDFNSNTTTNLNGTVSIIEFNGINEVPTQDYKVVYSLISDQLGIYSMSTYLPDSLVTCDEFGRGFVSLIIEPESNEDVGVIEKNFTLVVDRSGSMNGEKMDQAKAASEFIVNNLNGGDKFNIIDFSSNIESFADGHVEATEENVLEAIDYIYNMDAEGGTNIDLALVTAITEFSVVEANKANIIIFFTDGEATYGETNTNNILSNVSSTNSTTETNVFLFTFGIGESVNKPLLTLLAQENSGLVNFLGNQDLEEEITSFFLKVNNPVVINTSIEITPEGSIESFHPSLMPNLYKGQQLIISGRYETPQDVNITLEGMAFNLPVSYDFPISLSDSMVIDQSFLPKIWAKQKIDELSLDYIIAGNSSSANMIQDEIDELSTCYNVVSVAFSSFSDPTLEVELVSFELRQRGNDIVLDWITAMELNNDKFVIERSQDGIDYEEIGEVTGAGNSTTEIEYEFIDRFPLDGIAYYRLKQIDIDGRVSYSEVRVIIIDEVGDKTYYSIYPNPLPHGESLFLDSNKLSDVTIHIMDSKGRNVYCDTVKSKAPINTPELLPGNYMIKLSSGVDTYSFKLFVR